ncbi:MAG: hypothetical protein M0P31_13790 [Solirubrobacteraceae bacterium]|nr:hypothetical protein [Solirubrobacteraceae bacterium]
MADDAAAHYRRIQRAQLERAGEELRRSLRITRADPLEELKRAFEGSRVGGALSADQRAAFEAALQSKSGTFEAAMRANREQLARVLDESRRPWLAALRTMVEQAERDRARLVKAAQSVSMLGPLRAAGGAVATVEVHDLSEAPAVVDAAHELGVSAERLARLYAIAYGIAMPILQVARAKAAQVNPHFAAAFMVHLSDEGNADLAIACCLVLGFLTMGQKDHDPAG